MSQEIFINKINGNEMVTVDLLDFKPKEKSLLFDIKEGLFMELLLKEKEFRTFLSKINWEIFRDKYVAIGCTSDAIVPMWAYMVIADKLSEVASGYAYSTPEQLDIDLWRTNILSTDFNHLFHQKVVVRQSQQVPPELYIAITSKLKPLVRTLMYGEAGLPKVILKNKKLE
ncbi:DUF2480 family protein [Mangrovimonas sp. AS39]|uniref:DUF2480 family protein n=1 Tax=Mangrovimonas futianensis TaxID=2895523 RepID=UPI001E45FD2E|nr:DUF2480 family protein [Mangrovimonas futianensis]MCF1192221.1 DUF2480 family protein [Mangrovimonas futianensis]MCF1196030.1 DUF2480 family protein [Mangrovimonas futianensis]